MKPMLFNTDMVKAILAGKKTVTRRVIKPQPRQGEENPHRLPSGCWYFDIPSRRFPGTLDASVGPYWPPCQPGDVLYVRETWADPSATGWPIVYRADLPLHYDAEETAHGEAVDLRVEDFKWRPSIHMPEWAARLFLRVKSVRVERLQAITGDACACEGIPLYSGPIGGREAYYRKAFAGLWDSTIKPDDRATYGWEANPWVWVIEFERCASPWDEKEAGHE